MTTRVQVNTRRPMTPDDKPISPNNMPAEEPGIPVQTRTFEHSGIVQRYHFAGAGPHCIVHSGGPGIDWAYVRMPALERYFTMVYVEPLGTRGASRLPSHPNGYDVAMYASQLERIVDHLGCESAVLLGHSHGGFVVQSVALLDKKRVRALVLYDTAPTSGMDLFVAATEAMQAFGARHAGNAAAADVMQAWSDVPTVNDDTSYTAVLRRLFPAYFADYWAAESTYAPLREGIGATHVIGGAKPFDARGALSAIDSPTLVLAGRHDFICGPRWADELRGGIPNSVMVVFENSGHFAHIEQEDDFTNAIVSFARMHQII